MNIGRYETETTRRRATGEVQKRGTRTGMSVGLGVIFSTVFVGAGTAIALVGAKIIPVNPRTVHAPYAVLMIAGIVFAMAGLTIAGMTVGQFRAERRRRLAAKQYGADRAMLDYPWNHLGFEPSRWKPAMSALLGSIFMTLFLTMFNFWAFFADGPIVVKIVVTLFDLIALYTWYIAVLKIGRALKFSDSHVEFLTFPYRISNPVQLRWHPPKELTRATKGSFTLRCVEEWFEETGTGKNRTTRLVQEELWSGIWILEEPRMFARGEQLDLQFEIPQDVPPTNLSAAQPLFWELVVVLEQPGFDFEGRYLIPVY